MTRSDMLMQFDKPLIETILSAIGNAALLIADLSDANPNVMYEVGFARSQNKPLIVISNNTRNVPFDLAGIPVLIYDLKAPREFIDRLAETIKAAVRAPDTFAFGKVVADSENRRSVFISYCHTDRSFLDRLLIHLRPLEQEGLIDLWVDTRLRPGDRWKKEIERALKKARVAVLLISADYLASDFITGNELPPLLKSAEERGTRIIPLIVKPCRFGRDKNLRQFHAANDPKEALVLLPDGKQESYFDAVAEEVERSLQVG